MAATRAPVAPTFILFLREHEPRPGVVVNNWQNQRPKPPNPIDVTGRYTLGWSPTLTVAKGQRNGLRY